MEIFKIELNLSYEEIKTDLIKFSQVIVEINKRYPLVTGVLPGVVTLNNKNGSYVIISTNSIKFIDVPDKDTTKALNFLKETIATVCKIFEIQKFSQSDVQFLGMIKAVSPNWQRPLLKGLTHTLPDKIINELEIESYKFGTRIFYTRNKQEYELRIEPYLKDSKLNFFSIGVTFPGEINIDKYFEAMKDNLDYVLKKINNIVEGDK